MNLRNIPVRAWPGLLRYSLQRRLASNPPTAELSDADLDFFMGGTDAVETHRTQPAFRFFPAEALGPMPNSQMLEDILAHRVNLLGRTFEVGQPIRWRTDFATGHTWPKDHISKLKIVTTEGDVKVPWELSRFQHGLVLARAYAATGETRYAQEWADQFWQWQRDNPPELGPNWANAMEAAIRAANWIAAYAYLRPALNAAASEGLLKALIQHGRFIASHLEEYWPPTNHILADYCGLIWIGLCLRSPGKNELASAEPKRWLQLGWQGLQRQLREQVLPDGADYEASTAYHRFVTEMVGSTVRLMALNEMFLPPALLESVTQMELVTASLQKPDGSLPLFGDEDGGHFPAPLATTQATSTVGWRSFSDGGWYVYRDDEEYLAVRAGSNGQAGWGGHAHNDALSFEYSLGPRNFLIDPGTYTYTSDPESRNLFRSTAYHNTVKIDDQEISRIPPGELFRLEDDVRVKAEAEGPNWQGQHTGYGRLGVTHQRRFERQAQGWLIRDTFSGSDDHSLEWNFHFAADCPVTLDGNKVLTGYAQGPNLSLTSSLVAAPQLLEGWVSPTYGVRLPALIAKYTLRAQLPVEVTFIISRL